MLAVVLVLVPLLKTALVSGNALDACLDSGGVAVLALLLK